MPDITQPETVGDILGRPSSAGHNAPPLAELLAEETATLKARADELIASAGRATVTDDATAGRATALAKMIADQLTMVEKGRKDRKEPFLTAERTVDAHYNAMKAPLETAKKMLVGLLDGFRRQKEAAARRAQAEADAAAAKAAITGSLDSAIEAQQLATKAETVTAAAAEVPKPVIDSGLGAKAFGRKVATVDVTDLLAACAYLIETQEEQVREFVQGRFNALARSGARKLPGATVTEDTATSIR